jgi:hypothetical protein
MKAVLATIVVILLAGPAMAAPGEPRAVRGYLEWPASLSAEPFIVVRGDDGRVYSADVSTARRVTAGAIAGHISMVGIEGNQPHEIAAVVVGTGDSALTFATPGVPAPTESSTPSSLPRQATTPAPSAIVPPPPPAAVLETPVAPPREAPEDLWRVQGRVAAVSSREFVVETSPGETVRVDVSKLSGWARQSVRAGDQVKLFGVPQKDNRLVANGFIQEVAPREAPSR